MLLWAFLFTADIILYIKSQHYCISQSCPENQKDMCGMAESLCCPPEAITTLLIGYTLIQNKKLKKYQYKSDSQLCLVAQLCLTLCDLMDCSPPGSSVHGNSPGKNTGVGCHALFQRIVPTQGLNPGPLHCRRILYHLSHRGSPEALLCNTNCKLIISQVGLSWDLGGKKVCVYFFWRSGFCACGGWQIQKLQGSSAGWRPVGELWVWIQKWSDGRVYFSFGKVSVFLRLSTDWTRPTPIMERNLLWLQVGWFKW